MALSSYLTHRVASMLVPRMLNTLGTFSRHASGREDCSKEPEPKCHPDTLAQSVCMEKREARKKDLERKLQNEIWPLLADNSCCPPPCPEFPRFDDMYYKESDKVTRIYQRTWEDCPLCLVRPKKVCCPPKDPYPPIPRRKRPPPPLCPPDNRRRKGRSHPCPVFKLKGCKEARKPPRCNQQRKIVPCKKRCTPYPSFSECAKDKFRIPKPSECYCMRLPISCEIYMEVDNMIRTGQKKMVDKLIKKRMSAHQGKK